MREVRVTTDDARDFKPENGHDCERCWVEAPGRNGHWVTWSNQAGEQCRMRAEGYWGWNQLPDYEVWQGLNEGEP
jgi:hypothetical protein